MHAESAQIQSSTEPRPGDILLFVRPHRFFDYVIKLCTLSKYYHVAIYAGNGHVVEARPKGIVQNGLEGREGGYDVIPAPEGRGSAALAWALTQLGEGFDRWNMLVVLLEHIFVRIRLNRTPHGKYSCGEFAATAFHHAGIRLFPDRDLNDIEPKDFASLKSGAATEHTEL